jgi:hypothetical protein
LDFTINHIESSDSDIDDKYDTEAIGLFTKKFKRYFKKKINKNKNIEKDDKKFLSFTAKFHDSKKESIDALHELDVLKQKHLTLENMMHILFETNKLLEAKVANLQVELDKANATFKKLNAGTQVLDDVLKVQKVTSKKEKRNFNKAKCDDKAKSNSSTLIPFVANKAKSRIKEKNVKRACTKPNLPKAKAQSVTIENTTTNRGEVNFPKFVPICHHCGNKGHIRPHCKKIHITYMNRTHVESPHGLDKLIPICHFCGVNGHTRPRCFNLHGCTTARPQYHANSSESKIYRPRHKVTPQPKDKNVISKLMPKVVRKVEEVKTKFIWVRKSNLIAYEDLPTSGIGLAF